MTMTKTAWILFTRVPVPGKVKTRLLPCLGGTASAALQRAMTLDTAWTLVGLDGTVFVFYSDEGPAELLQGLPETAKLYPQVGSGLGERMYHAIETVLDLGYDRCLLLGSDLPLLTSEAVMQAARILEQADVVLGPSQDGGYWLIGMHRPFRPVFEGQRYGTGSVLANAVACCEAAGLRVGLGPVWSDLDTPEDLKRLWKQVDATPGLPYSRTVAWLRENDEIES